MLVRTIRSLYGVVLLFAVLVAVQPSWASETLFTTQTPAQGNFTDGPNYELGTAFTSDIAGQVTAIRFWKAPSESGIHTGNIWSSTGQLLVSVTFTNETASGWQQQALAAPLPIAANTIYVVSVNTASTYFVYTPGGLSSQVTNGDLSSVVGNNGLVGTPGTFPTISAQGNNFFRDIVFVPGGLPLQSGSNCNGIYSGTFSGNVTVVKGQTCTLVNGTVSGNITLTGGSLELRDFAVAGNVTVQTGGAFSIGPTAVIGGNLTLQAVPASAGQSQLCGSTLRGNLVLQSSGAPVLIGSDMPSLCAGNTIGGNLTIQSDAGSAGAIGNTVIGNLTIQSNTAAVTANNNVVTANVVVQGNTAATSVDNNIVTGNLLNQSNTAPTQVFGNIVVNVLQCQGNLSITGGGNTAGQKLQQCVTF